MKTKLLIHFKVKNVLDHTQTLTKTKKNNCFSDAASSVLNQKTEPNELSKTEPNRHF